MTIGLATTRVSLLTYSSKAVIHFKLNQVTDNNQALTRLNSISRNTGRTYTNLALQSMKDNLLTSAAGDRSDIPNVGQFLHTLPYQRLHYTLLLYAVNSL